MQGMRLPAPGFFTDSQDPDVEVFCPDELYTLWMKCWSIEPNERPTFGRIVEVITCYLNNNSPNNMLHLLHHNLLPPKAPGRRQKKKSPLPSPKIPSHHS